MNLPSFANAKVLVVGDVMLDRYWFGDVERISPEAPVPVLKVGRVEERPGGAANVARNISARCCRWWVMTNRVHAWKNCLTSMTI
jgi:bifunctional ADP-heptose synthase (sugar kinase/adenylyltransferase)